MFINRVLSREWSRDVNSRGNRGYGHGRRLDNQRTRVTSILCLRRFGFGFAIDLSHDIMVGVLSCHHLFSLELSHGRSCFTCASAHLVLHSRGHNGAWS